MSPLFPASAVERVGSKRRRFRTGPWSFRGTVGVVLDDGFFFGLKQRGGFAGVDPLEGFVAFFWEGQRKKEEI